MHKILLSPCFLAAMAKEILKENLYCSRIMKHTSLRNTIIFDLDGTLLDTLEDLADAVNFALRQFSLPTHSYDAVRMMVGNGVRKLVVRAVGDENHPQFEDIFSAFKTYYVSHCRVKTRLYDGIAPLLSELRGRGYRLAIVSNKLQAGVTELQREYFENLIDVAIGEREGISRKPAPDMLNAALEALGSTADEAIYVGDSDVDVATARNSGMPCISVLWGFRDEAFLREHGATLFAATPAEILNYLD